MKAYACYDMPVNRHYDIVYAINAGKAKSIAWNIFNKDDFVISYTYIRVRRLPILDDCYKGETLLDWYDMKTRSRMVKIGWYCTDLDKKMCEECLCRFDCLEYYEDD